LLGSCSCGTSFFAFRVGSCHRWMSVHVLPACPAHTCGCNSSLLFVRVSRPSCICSTLVLCVAPCMRSIWHRLLLAAVCTVACSNLSVPGNTAVNLFEHSRGERGTQVSAGSSLWPISTQGVLLSLRVLLSLPVDRCMPCHIYTSGDVFVCSTLRSSMIPWYATFVDWGTRRLAHCLVLGSAGAYICQHLYSVLAVLCLTPMQC
jgi:hypothetical protein